MGRTRRRYKPVVLSQSSSVEDVCVNCRLVQKDSSRHSKESRNTRRQHNLDNKQANSKSDTILNFLLDCESETDSAIDTASISSSSDSNITSLSAYSASLEDCRVASPPPRTSKVAVVSIADIEKREAETDLLALTEFVTGVPFQKFTTKDSCVECIKSYERALHKHQHYHMQMSGIQDAFTLDLTGHDIAYYVEEYSNWSHGNTTVQTKENSYYVSAQGATYYTEVPRDANILSLPKQLMIPQNDLPMFSLTHPPPRSWIAMSTPQRSKPTAIFTVMNYNILANRACTKSLYGYTPEWALHWDYRRRGILEEIRHYSADIICLQEVETEQFDKFFSVEFAKDGYVGVFASKRTHAGSAESRKTQDGCATFWRKNKFKMVDQETIEFGTHARNHANGSPAILNRVQSKDHVGHFVVLETLEGVWDTNGLPSPDYVSRKLLVTNTHVIWDPVQCDVKIVQTIILMEAMKSFLKTKFNIENVSDMPLVLCGDFNSLPESAVVEFLMNGTVCSEHSEFQSFDYSVLDSACTRQDGQHDFSHPFKLRNPYEDKTSTSGATTKYHMNETNYTYNFKGIIDYILHTEHMTPLGVLGPVDPVWFKDSKVVGCPHPHIPSDHFSLLTEFELGVLHKNDNSQVSHTKK